MNSIDGVRVIGSFDPNEISDMTGLRCVDESLTHQEFKEEQDKHRGLQAPTIRVEGVVERIRDFTSVSADQDVVHDEPDSLALAQGDELRQRKHKLLFGLLKAAMLELTQLLDLIGRKGAVSVLQKHGDNGKMIHS